PVSILCGARPARVRDAGCWWLVFALAVAPARASLPGAARSAPAPRILQFDSPARVSKAERAAVFEEYAGAFRAAFARGDFASARDLAEHAAAVFPELRRPWLQLAAARFRLDEWGAAIEAARRGEQAADDRFAPPPTPEESYAGAAYWEGVALYATQRSPEALARLHAAHDRAPRWAEAARALAECVFVSGKPADATPLYAAAFDLDPTLGTTRDLSYFAE